jgi:hypothetical protein
VKIFGFEIKREDEETGNAPVSFAEPQNDDGAITVGNAMGGFYSTILDMEGSAKTESELVTKYRSLAMQPEINQAVDEIVNEAISVDLDEDVVELILDDVDLPDKVKDKLTEELSELRYLPNDIERMQEAQTKTDNDLYDLQIRIEELRD